MIEIPLDRWSVNNQMNGVLKSIGSGKRNLYERFVRKAESDASSLVTFLVYFRIKCL